MVTLAVWVMLEAAPSLWAEGAPRRAQLIAAETSAKSYGTMTRAQLLAERRAIEAARPGIVLPVLMMCSGGVIAVGLAIGFWVGFANPYGLAVYSAAILITAFVVAIAIIVTGTIWLARSKPLHDDLGTELELIDEAERALGPASPQTRPPGFIPQVNVTGPEPSLVIASF